MNGYRYLFVVVGLLLFTQLPHAYAQNSCPSGDAWCVAQNSWSEWDNLSYVYPTNEGTAFTFSQVNSPDGTCNGGRQFIINTADSNYDAKMRTLLSAFMAGRQIRVFVDADAPTAGCYIHIDRLMVR